VKRAGWDELSQIREEVSFIKGRIIIRGKLVTRGKATLEAYNEQEAEIAAVAFSDKPGLSHRAERSGSSDRI
jgi:hypothetical protein